MGWDWHSRKLFLKLGQKVKPRSLSKLLFELLILIYIITTVYALDRLEKPSPEFYNVQAKAQNELGTSLHYRQIDVRDEAGLNKIIEKIGKENGRLDGLIAAAGIQQETTAFDYNAADFNRMLEVNVTGVFLTAQAAAKQMVKFGNGGSIVMIASMSGTIANKVGTQPFVFRNYSY